MIMKKTLMIKNKGFSLIELSIVLIIIAIIVSMTYISMKVKYQAQLANAINMTATADFINKNSLVLWLETSLLSKEGKENQKISKWLDNSKNNLKFEATSNPPILRKSKAFPAIKSIYFNGSNHLESEKPLNLSQYTAFAVIVPDENNSSIVFDSGFNVNSSNIQNNRIIVIKNDGSNKFLKTDKEKDFKTISNSDDLNIKPLKFYLGMDKNGGNKFKGEILELIVFDKILSKKDIVKIENYLNNKYKR